MAGYTPLILLAVLPRERLSLAAFLMGVPMLQFPRVVLLAERESAALYARFLVDRRLLTISQASVYSWLLFVFFHEDAGFSVASTSVLASRCLVSKSTVWSSVLRLESFGLVRRLSRTVAGSGVKAANGFELFGPARRVDAELAALALPKARARGGPKIRLIC
jgi:hypothetical protein